MATCWPENATEAGRRLKDRFWLKEAIGAAEVDFAEALEDERWRTCFSGKELLHEIYGYTHGGGVSRRDLVLALGETQRRNGAIPAEVAELRVALRRAAGSL